MSNKHPYSHPSRLAEDGSHLRMTLRRFSFLIPEERAVRRASRRMSLARPLGSRRRFAPPHHEGKPVSPHPEDGIFAASRTIRGNLRPDCDFRLGVGVGLQFLQRAAVFDRHYLAELRQI